MYVFGFFYSIINTCSPCFQVLYFLYPRFPYSDSDCIPEHFPDRSADHKVGAAVNRRHRLVDQDPLMSSLIIDQSSRRIYSQGSSSDDQNIRICDIIYRLFDRLRIQSLFIEHNIRLDCSSAGTFRHTCGI